MLRPRLIPCLLIRNGGLVKTVRFGDGKYIGDPLNAVRIFNEKEVDELIVLDIDATKDGRAPNQDLIRALASECRMPLCYGGGIATVEQAGEIIRLGVEKVALGAAAIETPEIVSAIAHKLGSQSVVVVIDVKKKKWRGRYEVYARNGTVATGREPVEYAKEMQRNGAGEILLNSIDRDGMMQGYDMTLAKSVKEGITIPLTILGGAGSLQDAGELVQALGTIGAAAGSLFVFKGKYRAVLINYPRRDEKSQLLNNASN